MIQKYALVAAVLGVAAFALWHPVRQPAIQTTALAAAPQPAPADETGTYPHHRRARSMLSDDPTVVYVAGAVKQPGLYRLRSGDRNEQAIALAGGLSPSAQVGAVNLAQRVNDGDEIYVPTQGEALHTRTSQHRSRRHASPPPEGSVDVNAAAADQLASVPGIGRSIASRIVELRQREGSFALLDELLDVAGMTSTRLERARPYLRGP